MKLQRFFTLLVLTFFTFALTTPAQSTIPGTSPTDGVTPAPLVKGAHPLGTYGGSNFDKVNLFNGNLSLTFPLAGLNGRGGLGASVVLSYNSKFWRIENTEPISPGGPVAFPVSDDWDSGLPYLTPGWTLHAGRLMVRQSGHDIHTCNDPAAGDKQYWKYTTTNVTFTAPDGTEYEFKDVAHDYGKPYLFADSLCPQSQDGGSRGTKFVTRDGTATDFTYDHYNNVLTEQVSAFGTGAPGGVLRTVSRDYVTGPTQEAYVGETISNQDVLNRVHLRSLINKETISGPNGVESVTDVTYDNYSAGMDNTGLADDSRLDPHDALRRNGQRADGDASANR